MSLEGGCYCGSLRYTIEGDPMMKLQCHCRECQYISGGSVNMAMAVPDAGFSYTKGAPKGFTRSDLESPVTREFCAECGTHILARAPGLPGAVVLKVGTLDDPSVRSKGALLGAAGTAYPGGPFGARGLESADSYVIGGNTLTVSMFVGQPGDWIRVITATAVPEPGTLALLGIGLFGMGLARRRRKV